MGAIEETSGSILGFIVLVDIFLLILYAHANKTMIRTEVSRVVWPGLVWLSKPMRRWRGYILAFSGEIVLVMILASWTLLLRVAAALILQANLDTGIQSNYI